MRNSGFTGKIKVPEAPVVFRVDEGWLWSSCPEHGQMVMPFLILPNMKFWNRSWHGQRSKEMAGKVSNYSWFVCCFFFFLQKCFFPWKNLILKGMLIVRLHLETPQVLMMFKCILLLCSGWHFSRILCALSSSFQ